MCRFQFENFLRKQKSIAERFNNKFGCGLLTSLNLMSFQKHLIQIKNNMF